MFFRCWLQISISAQRHDVSSSRRNRVVYRRPAATLRLEKLHVFDIWDSMYFLQVTWDNQGIRVTPLQHGLSSSVRRRENHGEASTQIKTRWDMPTSHQKLLRYDTLSSLCFHPLSNSAIVWCAAKKVKRGPNSTRLDDCHDQDYRLRPKER